MPLPVIWAVLVFSAASVEQVTTESLQDLDGLGFIQMRQEMKLARQPRLDSLAIQDGLIVDLRGNVGILPDTWENQVSGGVDGEISSGVVYDNSEKAFHINGQPIILRGLATSPTRMPDVTFVVWVKLLQASGEGYVLIQRPGYGYSRALCLRSPLANGISANMAEMAGGIDFGHGYANVGTWDHYVLTYSASGPCAIWVNGVKSSRSICSPGTGNSNEHLFIGALPDFGGHHSSDVMVSSVAVYNRVLLDSEVATLYTGNRARASGDPHCTNLRGEHFNVYSVGEVEFITVPRVGEARGKDLKVVATLAAVTPKPCAPTFIRMVSISGGLLGGAPALNVSVNSNGVSFNNEWMDALTGDTQHQRASLYNMSLRTSLDGKTTLVQVHVQALKLSIRLMDEGNLNFGIKGLDSLGDTVGGLLGLDPHASVVNPLPGCADKTSRIELAARTAEDSATVSDTIFWHAVAA